MDESDTEGVVEAVDRLWSACDGADRLLEEGEIEAGRIVLSIVALSSPPSSYASWRLGHLLLEEGDIAGAEQHFIAATRSENWGRAWLDLGTLLQGQEQNDRALAALSNAIECDDLQARLEASVGKIELCLRIGYLEKVESLTNTMVRTHEEMKRSGDSELMAYADAMEEIVINVAELTREFRSVESVPSRKPENEDLGSLLTSFDTLALGEIDDFLS